MSTRTFVASLLWIAGWTTALALCGPAAHASDRAPSHRVKACGMSGTPSSVVVDVYDDAAPGALLATIPNGEVSQVGSTDCYQADLATTTAAISYPSESDPGPEGYTVVFRDDAANTVELTEIAFGFPFPSAWPTYCERKVPIYASSAVPSRGITAAVMAAGLASYMRIEVDCTQVFTSPDLTYYEVLFYDASGRVSDYRPSMSPPSP